MKKKSRKSVQKKLSAGVVGILALGFGLGLPLQGAELTLKKVPNVRHELVPHVVLPETIQYNKVAQSLRSQPGISTAGDYGIVSPFVATYTAFPSYQIPLAAEMKGVNQSVYPVSPKLLPKPLPLNKAVEEEPTNGEAVIESDLTKTEKDAPASGMEAAPILLASNSEEVVPATPSAMLSNEVTQTGIFCQKPAKPPAAWSFTSPIFKAASVPMGWGGPAGTYNGYINQTGPRGCTTNVGFQPTGQGGEFQPGAPIPYPYPPMNTCQIGHGFDNGPQAQMLPNGMVLLTVPPNHAQCGPLRCRNSSPRMMLLPGTPGGIPGMLPSPPIPQTPPPAPSAMMMPGFGAGLQVQSPYQMPFNPMVSNPIQPNPMQQQMMPVVSMTPYGATIVGYQPVPINQMGDMGMGFGMGMMPAQQFQAMQLQQQQLQALQFQQFQAQQLQAMQAGLAASQLTSAGTLKSNVTLQSAENQTENQEETANDLQTPLPINSQTIAGMAVNPYGNPYAVPYSLYAQQVAAANQNGIQAAGTPDQTLMPPQMFAMPQPSYGNPYAGAYMTPYGMMSMGQPNPMMGSFGGGMPMMPVGFQPGMPQPGMNQGGMSMSDVIQLVTLLNNNNQRHRRGLFQRIAERRESRQERNTQNDPLNQLMQAWSTPYMAPDAGVRMPARNTYPYGYFGAQAGPQDTANYGGYYNLYMGNTSYPGLY